MSADSDDTLSKVKALAITVGRSASTASDLDGSTAKGQSSASEAKSKDKNDLVISEMTSPTVPHQHTTIAELAQKPTVDLEKIAVGMYPSYVLETSREPLSLNTFYHSVKKIHDVLNEEFNDFPIHVKYCLGSENYSLFFQDDNSSFDHLQQLLTNEPEFRSERQEFLAEENEKHRLPRFTNHKLDPWSHVTYAVDGFAQIHVSYEHFTPLQLFNITPGDHYYQRILPFLKETGKKRNLKRVLNGAIGGAVLGGYFTSGIIGSALIGVACSLTNLGYDLIKNPIYGTTVDCEAVLDSSVPKEHLPELTGHLEGFIQALNQDCSFPYRRDSTIATEMREYMRSKAAQAKKRK